MEPLERDNRGQTVLHFAARIGNKEVFQHVAETGVNISGQINARDANGNTCVHLAVKHWRGCLLNYLLATFLGAIQLNVKNNEGFTPFLLAVHGGNTHIVQLLFEWGNHFPPLLLEEFKETDTETVLAFCPSKVKS